MNFRTFYYKVFQEKVHPVERAERIFNTAFAVGLLFSVIVFGILFIPPMVKLATM